MAVSGNRLENIPEHRADRRRAVGRDGWGRTDDGPPFPKPWCGLEPSLAAIMRLGRGDDPDRAPVSHNRDVRRLRRSSAYE
jgi:hypothetical protein